MSKPEPQVCECTSCHYVTTCESFPIGAFMDRPARDRWLCAFCCHTFAGNAVEHPGQYGTKGELMQHVCAIANAVVDALGGDRSRMFPKEPTT